MLSLVTKTPSKRAALYIRVSSAEQATDGLSLDVQESKLRAYATMRGLEVVEVIRDEGVSAYKTLSSRAGGKRLLGSVAKRRVDAVIAVKLDRLFRNAADCLATVETWDRADIALHLVDQGGTAIDTQGAMGRFFLTIMAGAAELERNMTAERTRDVLRDKKSRNQKTGGDVPYGKSVEIQTIEGKLVKVLVDSAEEQAVIAQIRAMAGERREVGTEGRVRYSVSVRDIASELANMGVLRRGNVWTHDAVARALKDD